MGEYARSMAIANGAAARWPGAAIHFILSRAAPYAASASYPVTLLESSPTFHSEAVSKVIREWQPDVVVFDNAGRTAQLREARRSGARVVYLSARPRQRRKAFRLRWMGLIDEHWIAYPEFIAGSLTWLEKLKLRMLKRPRVRYLDVVLTMAAPMTQESIGMRIGVAGRNYVLVVPGGGTGHPGAADAVEIFVTTARALAAAGVETIIVGREAVAEQAQDPRLHMLGALPQAELAELMRGARLIIANGGSTLLQSIACGKASIAVPIAADQRERIRRCERAGVVSVSRLDPADMLGAATTLLGDDAGLDALASRAAALGLKDGIDMALQSLAMLVATPAERR